MNPVKGRIWNCNSCPVCWLKGATFSFLSLWRNSEQLKRVSLHEIFCCEQKDRALGFFCPQNLPCPAQEKARYKNPLESWAKISNLTFSCRLSCTFHHPKPQCRSIVPAAWPAVVHEFAASGTSSSSGSWSSSSFRADPSLFLFWTCAAWMWKEQQSQGVKRPDLSFLQLSISLCMSFLDSALCSSTMPLSEIDKTAFQYIFYVLPDLSRNCTWNRRYAECRLSTKTTLSHRIARQSFQVQELKNLTSILSLFPAVSEAILATSYSFSCQNAQVALFLIKTGNTSFCKKAVFKRWLEHMLASPFLKFAMIELWFCWFQSTNAWR